jgi:hypothetical protein
LLRIEACELEQRSGIRGIDDGEQARLQMKAMSPSKPTEFEPLPVQPLHPLADIGPLYAKPRPRHQSARSKQIDAVLAKHGIRAK